MLALFILLTLVVILLTASYLTDPFTRFTVVKLPFQAHRSDERINATDENHQITVRQELWWKAFAWAKNGIQIVSSRYISRPSAKASTVSGIITDIRRHRFNPKRLLLISGDHFSALFVRNLGIFYYPTLDTRIADSEDEWRDRQAVYLQTLGYALGVFKKHPIPATTIVPTGRYRATCVNVYAYPPDTVYSLMYALSSLLGKEKATAWDYSKPTHKLETVQVAEELLENYRETLRKLYDHYYMTVYDHASGLVRKDMHFSGAKDITRRQGSFYDNVMLWKTASLAMELGIIKEDDEFLYQLKRRITKAFWLEREGYFLEDLSDEGIKNRYYSSEWLIALITGFLDPAKTTERQYYERSVAYIRRQVIDKPFPLKYHHDTRGHRQFWIVRMAVASYGGDAIWSFWGMEYIKTLLRLYEITNDQNYLRDADKHIKSYKKVMLRDGGFPEVYDNKGNLLQTFLYRSIIQTGWVIGFEQVLAMRKALKV